MVKIKTEKDKLTLEQRIESEVRRFEVKQVALLAMKNAGFNFQREAPHKQDELAFPLDITELTPQKLGDLHGHYVSMGCYARTLVSKAQVEEDISEMILSYVKDRVMLIKADVDEAKVTFTKANVKVSSVVNKEKGPNCEASFASQMGASESSGSRMNCNWMYFKPL